MRLPPRPCSKPSARAIELTALQQRLGQLDYRPIGLLKFYDTNPRKHPEPQIIKLMASMTEFGFALPLLIDADNEIIAGEARLKAAQRLNLTEVPVIVADKWSKAQVRAYRLADNRLAELAEWDTEILALELSAIIELDEVSFDVLGWETAEMDVIIEANGPAASAPDAGDEVPDLPAVAASLAGDLWRLGKHRLLCGSSLEASSWTTLMAGETAAMVFEDPPFNVKIEGHVSGLGSVHHDEFAMASGEMSSGEFTDFLAGEFGEMMPHLKDGAVLTLAMDWRHSTEMLSAIERNSLTVINLCVWNKTNGGMGSLYRSKHELFWIAKKGTAPHTNNVQLGKHGRYRTNVWDYAGANTFGKTRMKDLADHPTVKPLALVADAIRDVTHPNEIVIDGFTGSGTTILAAESTGRRGYGIELAPGYVDVAVIRWQTMTGQQAVLAETGETFTEVAERRAAERGDDVADE